MRTLFIAILLFTSSLATAFEFDSTYSIVESNKIESGLNLFQYNWTENNEELCFDITTVPGLKFVNTYSVYTVTNGQGCEITCIPEKDHEFYSPDGSLVKQLKIYAQVKNTLSLKKIEYLIEVSVLFEKKDSKGTIVQSEKNSTVMGTMGVAKINLQLNPEFFTYIDAADQAIIIFKKLYPGAK